MITISITQIVVGVAVVVVIVFDKLMLIRCLDIQGPNQREANIIRLAQGQQFRLSGIFHFDKNKHLLKHDKYCWQRFISYAIRHLTFLLLKFIRYA